MTEKFLQVSDTPFIQLRHRFLTTKNPENKHRTIIIIPGWLGTIEERLPLAESFLRFANVIIYEPRGYGKSSAPHKRKIWKLEYFAQDLAKIIEYYRLKEGEFYIWGSCVGAAIAFQYYLSKLGPKPKALLLASPQDKFKTKWWFNLFKWAPYFLLVAIEKIVVFFLELYLKMKNPEEVKNVKYAVRRFTEADLYVQLRILIELIHEYDIRDQKENLDLPILVFSAQQDWFTLPENAKQFVTFHPQSMLIELGNSHRIIDGNEMEIGNYIATFIEKLEKNTP
ncbi:MAG: alpha/beta fold hydrolase [Candidatus Heimdallarchaeaceae archaeon]